MTYRHPTITSAACHQGSSVLGLAGHDLRSAAFAMTAKEPEIENVGAPINHHAQFGLGVRGLSTELSNQVGASHTSFRRPHNSS